MSRLKIDNYYAKTDDKFVKGVTLYYKSADGILYYEAAYTNKVAKADLIDLFLRGDVIVKDGDDYARPALLEIETNYATVSYTGIASSAATTKAYHSDGYTAAG